MIIKSGMPLCESVNSVQIKEGFGRVSQELVLFYVQIEKTITKEKQEVESELQVLAKWTCR